MNGQTYGLSELPDADKNERAVRQFVDFIRNPELAKPSSDNYGRTHVYGFKINPSPSQVERAVKDKAFAIGAEVLNNGWLTVNPNIMEDNRYKMPVALYISGGHAHLVLNVVERSGEIYVTLYNPSTQWGTQETNGLQTTEIKLKKHETN